MAAACALTAIIVFLSKYTVRHTGGREGHAWGVIAFGINTVVRGKETGKGLQAACTPAAGAPE